MGEGKVRRKGREEGGREGGGAEDGNDALLSEREMNLFFVPLT